MSDVSMVDDDEPIYRMRATFDDVCVFCDLPKMSVSVEFGCQAAYNPHRSPNPYEIIKRTCAVKIHHTLTSIMDLASLDKESRVDYDITGKSVTAIKMVVISSVWPILPGRLAHKVEFYRT